MADRPDDGFDSYYAEKLWELIPAIYRHEDGLAERPGVLRAMVEIIAAQAAVLRRSQDRLWDDQFIDLADEWAVPYLGDLVGTRLVSALNVRGRRVDVAKTVYYRRRKGTVRVLEELISDITGWEGKVTESFRGLARARHGLDPAPRGRLGRFSGTPPGGFADLRDVRAAALADGPFDEFAHTPDLRRQRGSDGIWNIPKIAFHLYRLAALEVEGVRPFSRADGVTFTFDPSGRDGPLFVPRRRLDDWDDWRSALPWEIPAPMSCRLLGHAEYQIEEALVLALEAAGLPSAAADELRTLTDVRFRNEAALQEQLSVLVHSADFLAPSTYDQILAGALVEDCGKRALLPAALQVAPAPTQVIPPERTVAGDLGTWTRLATGKDLIVDPERGRFKLLGASPAAAEVRVSYFYGTPGQIGAGTYDRSDVVLPPPKVLVPAATVAGGPIGVASLPAAGVAEIVDSATYGPVDDVPDVQSLVVQAADRQRPYVTLAADWILTAAPGIEATLTLDGIWFGASAPVGTVLRGAWSRVTIGHSVLDPGGLDVDGAPIHPVRLFVEGQVDELVIDRSIVAPIVVRPGGLIDRVTVTDSILDSTVAGGPAIALTPGQVVLRRVTVLGALDVERLDASEALITGPVEVTDTQNGCFRFSAAPAGSRLPRPYRSPVLSAAPHIFTSRVFGQPGYAQLAQAAPVVLRRGAENWSEIGAWSSGLDPIKQDSLARKVDEYLPFGLIPCFIRWT